MAKVTAKVGALVEQSSKIQGKPAPKRMSDFLADPKTQEWILNSLGDKKEAQKFVSSILSATSNNKDLTACEKSSVISAALLAQSLNMSLSPQLGLCYLVPFKKKAKYDREGNVVEPETSTATFVLGYKGYIQLAIRSGYYKTINVCEVREGELKEFNPFTDEIKIDYIKDERERVKAPVIGYYAFLRLTNGFEKGIYWSYEKMLAHANQYSAAFNAEAYEKIQAGKMPEKDMWKYSSYWYKDFNGMAFKTMLRQLISKWGIMSIDMQTAYENEVKAEEEELRSKTGTTPIDLTDIPETFSAEQVANENLNVSADNVAVDSETGEILGSVPNEE